MPRFRPPRASTGSRARVSTRRAAAVTRAVAGLVAGVLSVALAGCTQDGGPAADSAGPGPDTAAQDTSAPPSPSEKLGLEPGWGPTRRDLDRAARLAGRLTVPELAGQVIVARWSGTEVPTRLVRRLHLGGVITFAENASTDAVRRADRTLQDAVRRPWPVLVGVDQEGGLVERVRDDATRFPTFMTAGAADRPRLTREAYAAQGRELRALGINVDFAPDADVTVGPGDIAIRSRSAGSDPERVAVQTVAAARGYLDGGVLPVVKHFPGHGSLTTDSHVALPVQRRSMAELRRLDLLPFRAAVEAGLPAVMTGHIAVQAVDPGVPASLSGKVVRGLLREKLGFEGVAFTDALEMAAVAGRRDPAVAAIRAGNDVVLMPSDVEAAHRSLVRAVRQDQLPRRRLEQAAARMIAMLRHGADLPGRGRAPGSAASAVRRLSSAAITVATGPCRGRLDREPLVPMGDTTAVARFRVAAERAGLALGSVTYEKPPRPERTGRKKQDRRRLRAWRQIEPTPVVNGTALHLLGTGSAPVSDGIAVALDTPYVLGAGNAPVEIATYGATPTAMAALVDVLTGQARAVGRLPVAVDGVERRGC